MKLDRDDMKRSARDNFIYCQDEAESEFSAPEAIFELLRSIAYSLAVIADHLTKTEMEDPDGQD